MTALPRLLYRNPEEVLEQLEEGSCAGCLFEEHAVLWGRSVETCLRGRQYGTRCRMYRENPANGQRNREEGGG